MLLCVVPYLTIFDQFLVSSYLIFALQGVLHWLVAELDMHLCTFDGMDFMWKTVDSGHPNMTALNSGNTFNKETFTGGHTHGKCILYII